MPDVLWLSQFFEGLKPELRPIFECLIEVEYAEQYEPEPTIREYLRGCLKSSGRREPTQHQPRHGEVNHRLTALGQPFIVFAQAA